MSSYNFREIEPKWQALWREKKAFLTKEDPNYPKEKRAYILDMFPYPSGAGLHVGHPEGYTATDIYSRFLRMNGFNVLHPMGFDSFGLPAENYALSTGVAPQISTEKNISHFREQIEALGFSYDWSRELQTHTPEYYTWTQKLFLTLYERGLAYEKMAPINWCDHCKTGLANEEVKNGLCERCHNPVSRKTIRQWMLKITEYAPQLLSGLDSLNWPQSVKDMQRNWIGKSSGASIKIKTEDGQKVIEVFTTRIDTLFGVNYIALAPEHPILEELVTAENSEAVARYKELAARKSDLQRGDLNKEKSGAFTGSYAVMPLTGKRVPIWTADYVMMDYGTGAVMAVGAHDQRDWEFSKAHEIPFQSIYKGEAALTEAFTGSGEYTGSGLIDGMTSRKKAQDAILSALVKDGIAQKKTTYKLRDWIFSRQRYWGEPIPLVHCPKCGIVPIPEKELPVTLPELSDYTPTEDGQSPLARAKEWLAVKCPKCGAQSTRETNTMPQWAGSCWYYLRYIDPKNKETFVSSEKEKYWMPVDLYIGGAEHSVLHLLYARFWHNVLFDAGLVSTQAPFQRLVNQGMITSFAFERKDKSLVPVDQVDKDKSGAYHERATGEVVAQITAKMSKSLKNVVNPDDIIFEYGADALRLYEMFMGPLEQSKPWQTSGITGISRFLKRAWALLDKPLTDDEPGLEIKKLLHQTIRGVTEDTKSLAFNTAISKMMVLSNALSSLAALPKNVLELFTLLLTPYAPHIGCEMWQQLRHETLASAEPWPSYDAELSKVPQKEIVVQINGKKRATLPVGDSIEKEAILKAALDSKDVQRHTEGKQIVKTILVGTKLLNIVVK